MIYFCKLIIIEIVKLENKIGDIGAKDLVLGLSKLNKLKHLTLQLEFIYSYWFIFCNKFIFILVIELKFVLVNNLFIVIDLF